MRKLSTVVSAVDAYSQSLGNAYMDIAGQADSVQKEVTEMQMRVQQAEDDVSYQLAQASELRAEAAAKVIEFGERLERAREEVRAAQAEVDDVLANPIPYTYEDSEGNVYTEYRVDEAALAAAQSRLSAAETEERYYEVKYCEAQSVEYEAEAVCTRFQNLQRAISSVNNMIQDQLYRIGQNNREIWAEGNYNLQCMRSILEKLNEYLACKRIFMPSRPV